MNATASRKKFKFTYNYVLVLICIVLFAAFTIANPGFAHVSAVLDMIKLTIEIGIMAMPLTFLIIMGCIDFSMCALVTLSAAVGGIVASYTNAFLGFIVSVLIGLLCGAFNGFMVSKLKLPPLITTLANMYLYKGLAEGATLASGYGTNVAATSIATFLGGSGIKLGSITIPNQLILMIILALVMRFILAKTVYGRTLYAIGLNENATMFAGINVVKIKFLTYVMAGGIFSIAGQVLMGRFSTIQYDSADSYLMQVIIACVLGGTNMNGGRGTIGGTLLGLSVVCILKGGMNAVALPQTQQKIILGLVLLASLITFQIIAEHDLKVKGKARMAAAAAEHAARKAQAN